MRSRVLMRRERVFSLLVLIVFLCAPKFASFSEVSAGKRGFMLTDVGNGIERFEFEVVGAEPVLFSSKVPYFLVKFTSPEMGRMGVARGMSGSPLFLKNGDFIGGLSLSPGEGLKEPYAFVTPAGEIREALNCLETGFLDKQLTPAAPLELSSSENVVDFDRKFRETVESEGLSGALSSGEVKENSLVPGGPVAVALVFGDFSVGAGGTVTVVEGKKFLIFSHSLFGGWRRVRLPVLPARVDAVLPSVFSSAKVMVYGKKVLGSTFYDTEYGVVGVLGEIPPLFPVLLEYKSGDVSKIYRATASADPEVAGAVVNALVSSFMDVVSENGGTISGKPVRLEFSLKLRNDRVVSSAILLTDSNLFQLLNWVGALSCFLETLERDGRKFSAVARVEVLEGSEFSYFSPTSAEVFRNDEGGTVVLKGTMVDREENFSRETKRVLMYEGDYDWLCWGNGCRALAKKLVFRSREEELGYLFSTLNPGLLWLLKVEKVRGAKRSGEFVSDPAGTTFYRLVNETPVDVSALGDDVLFLTSSGLVSLKGES